jgi:hypothetical protein
MMTMLFAESISEAKRFATAAPAPVEMIIFTGCLKIELKVSAFRNHFKKMPFFLLFFLKEKQLANVSNNRAAKKL